MGSSNIKKSYLKVLLLSAFLASFASTLRAEELRLKDEDHWVFSGVVTNEIGERYAYFFQMEHQGRVFRSAVVLFDMQSNEPLFHEESEQEIEPQSSHHWQVGQTFLHFNPITGSWVFGCKTKEKQGFNFKVDMMNTDATTVFQERLRPGLVVSLHQNKALNGHIYLSKKQDQFVTARHAWMSKTSASVQSEKQMPHVVNDLWCHFYDDSGLYAVKLFESDALQGAIAGRFDAEGQLQPMSQFIEIKKAKEGAWTIESLLPAYHFTLTHPVEQQLMTVGLVTEHQLQGTCMISHHAYTL